jgi:DNA helicase-4
MQIFTIKDVAEEIGVSSRDILNKIATIRKLPAGYTEHSPVSKGQREQIHEWFKDIYEKKQFRERASEIESQLSKLLASYNFTEAEKYYTEFSDYIDEETYTFLRRKYYEEYQSIQIKKKMKASLMENISKRYMNAKDYWMSNCSDIITEKEFNDILIEYVQEWFNQHVYTNKCKNSDKSPDKEQALAIAQVWHDIQVVARAGSGKTLTIINRAVFLVEHCNVKPSEILILAFNRNAALEVSDRLVRLMRGKEAPQSMTFHALAWAIIHPSEEFLKDDEDSGWQKSRQIQLLIDDYIRSNESAIQELMIQYFRRDWDNIVSKGYHLSPEEMVKHRRSLPYLGFDGYYYKSMGEKKIADYLFEHDVSYQYEKNFWWKGRNYKPDFYIQLDTQDSIGIVFEYFGLIGDPDYDEQIEDKRTFWKTKNDCLFQELNPSDINYLDQNIGVLLRQYHFPMHHLSDEEIWHRIRDREIDHFSKLVSQFIGRCRNALVSPEDLVKMANEKKSEYDDMVVSFLRIVWKIYNDWRILI